MMRRHLFVLGEIAAALLLAGIPARAQIRMEIVGPGSQLSAIALPALKDSAGDGQHEISKTFVHTLSRDLRLSGYFRIIDPHAYIEDSQKSGYEIGQFNLADWSSLNADFLVKGAVVVKGADVEVEARLFDIAQQRQMMGKRFTGGADEVERMARRFADAVLEAVTGTRGPFDSKIAFISTRGGRFKEVYTSTVDGQELFRVTNNPTINLFPCFDLSGRYLLYTSYKSGTPALYMADLVQRQEVRIVSSLGQVLGGALAPDAHSIVAAIEKNGATNLHQLQLAFSASDRRIYVSHVRTLTTGGAINVTPAFSPDNRKLAFASDRSGTPQIYAMDLASGRPERITYRGEYNTNPAFSPKGDKIAYQSRDAGKFDIYAVPASGGEPSRLTNGEGTNESPCWSPDGRYILFSSTRSGQAKLYLMQAESGKIISALMEETGNDTSPAWSWWLAD